MKVKKIIKDNWKLESKDNIDSISINRISVRLYFC